MERQNSKEHNTKICLNKISKANKGKNYRNAENNFSFRYVQYVW